MWFAGGSSFLCLELTFTSYISFDGKVWTNTNLTNPSSAQYFDVYSSVSNGQIWIVGSNYNDGTGPIFYSHNGYDWIEQTEGTNFFSTINYTAAYWDGSKFLIGGAYGILRTKFCIFI